MKEAVIIGSGLGGLECGYILSQHGYHVSILERDTHLGGCLQSFRRGDTLFDTGFHYVGGLSEGGPLYPIFRYLGLLDLPWQALDKECADRVVIGNRVYDLPQGHEAYYRYLAELFPAEREGLRQYIDTLKEIGEHIHDVFRPDFNAEERMTGLFSTSAYQWLNQLIHNQELIQVLSGTALKMQLDAERLPLYIFAQINNSFIHSAHRLNGGGNQIAYALRDKIVGAGGQIRLGAEVTRIIEEDGKAAGVELHSGEILRADIVISNAHPAVTMALAEGSKSVRSIYRKRIGSLRNTMGMFTANIRLKAGAIPYINHNIFVHSEDSDAWHPAASEHVEQVMIHMYPGEDALDLMTPMPYSRVNGWADKPIGMRGEDYVAWKEQICRECIALAEREIPGLSKAIAHIYTSTPLSYASYLNAPEGTAYGVEKDCREPMLTFLSPRTPMQGLFYTGQSLNLHGVLGVSMTALLTCREIMGKMPDGLLLN